MSVPHIVGVDPGLVHTGVVMLTFDSPQRIIEISSEAVLGPDAVRIQQFLGGLVNQAYIFIEGYRPRSNLNTDRRMTDAVRDIHKALPGSKVLDNMGVKKVIKPDLMKVLGCWSFPTPTHHQDLRSAARIALLGMVKDPGHNRLLANIVRDHLNGRPWNVAHG